MPFEDGVYSGCGQTVCTICVHLVDFTDYFSNYAFQVKLKVRGTNLCLAGSVWSRALINKQTPTAQSIPKGFSAKMAAEQSRCALPLHFRSSHTP